VDRQFDLFWMWRALFGTGGPSSRALFGLRWSERAHQSWPAACLYPSLLCPGARSFRAKDSRPRAGLSAHSVLSIRASRCNWRFGSLVTAHMPARTYAVSHARPPLRCSALPILFAPALYSGFAALLSSARLPYYPAARFLQLLLLPLLLRTALRQRPPFCTSIRLVRRRLARLLTCCSRPPSSDPAGNLVRLTMPSGAHRDRLPEEARPIAAGRAAAAPCGAIMIAARRGASFSCLRA